MTVAVVVKVYDGLVLAADSATSFELFAGGHQVYNNASKVFHLHRDKPIGAMTWGLGSIGPASVSTIAKDLRRRLMGFDPDYPEWELSDDYTIESVALRAVEMLFDEMFLTEFPTDDVAPPASLHLMVAGYSGGSGDGEVWRIELERSSIRPTPIPEIIADQFGWISFAQPEATVRLFQGIDPLLAVQIRSLVDPAYHPHLEELFSQAQRNPVVPAMPFPDAIDLAKFMVESTASYVHYLLGADTVGGVAEVAGINRHEGFRWVKRKHYYPSQLNPLETGHDR